MTKRHYEISLVSSNVVRQMQAMDHAGLCMKRFHADKEVGPEVDFARMERGDRMVVDGVDMEIDQVGKRCFPECVLVQSGAYCPLKTGCAFGHPVKCNPEESEPSG